MSAFIHHFSFDFRTGIRNKTLLLMNYLFPLGFYLMMGFVMGGINPTFVDTMIPAMVIFAVLAATFLGIPDPLVNARENGIFRSYKINGIPALSILVIPVLTTIVHLFFVSLIIAGSASLLFNAPGAENWLTFALTFFALAIACAGLGVLIGVISPNSRQTVLWAQLFFIPSILLSGIMFPYSLLPDIAGKIAQFLPATHAMNAFNGLSMGLVNFINPWISIAVLISSGLLALGLSIFLFSWDSRNTKRRGPIWLALIVFLPNIIAILLQ